MTQNTDDNTQKINEAVDAYFESNPEVNCFGAKKIMPALLKNGVFLKDKKNGMPLRQLLRLMDRKGELSNIPRVYAERIGIDVYWYFVREGAEFVSNHVSNAPNAKQKRAEERLNSDQVYLMDLIDELLKETGSRKHTFDYLLGDLHQNGETRTELPIDLYFVDLKLALEILEHPDKKKVDAKEEKLTVSGITRAEQRLRYLHRKKVVLTSKEKFFIEIPIQDFDVDDSMKMIRDKKKDESVLKGLLSDFMA